MTEPRKAEGAERHTAPDGTVFEKRTLPDGQTNVRVVEYPPSEPRKAEDRTREFVRWFLSKPRHLRDAWAAENGYVRAERRKAEGIDVPDGTAEFVAFAVEYLATVLGEEHGTVKVGRRIHARLATPPNTAEDERP